MPRSLSFAIPGGVEIDEKRIVNSTQAGAHSLQNSLGKLFLIGSGITGLEMGIVSCGAVWAPKLPSSSFSVVMEVSESVRKLCASPLSFNFIGSCPLTRTGHSEGHLKSRTQAYSSSNRRQRFFQLR